MQVYIELFDGRVIITKTNDKIGKIANELKDTLFDYIQIGDFIINKKEIRLIEFK